MQAPEPRAATPSPTPGSQRKWSEETLLSWHEWARGLVSFTTARPPDFHFKPGQFARLTLGEGDASVSRAFSVVSSPREPRLEFLAVLIPEGGFSHHLAQLHPGDAVRVDRQSYGFFTADNFGDGRDLWFLATGTGLAPFISMLRDGTVFSRFEHIVLIHSVRYARDLAYRHEITRLADRVTTDRLRYLPVVTREKIPGQLHGRITELLEQGEIEASARLILDEHHSRLMVCGNPEMCAELRQQLTTKWGLRVNRTRTPGQLIFENYW